MKTVRRQTTTKARRPKPVRDGLRRCPRCQLRQPIAEMLPVPRWQHTPGRGTPLPVPGYVERTGGSSCIMHPGAVPVLCLGCRVRTIERHRFDRLAEGEGGES